MSLEKSRSPLLFVLCLSLSHFSLSRPVFIQESVLESSMSDTSRAAFLQARKCWPDRGHEARIPAVAKQIYDSWMAAPADERRIALDAAVASGLTRIQGRDNDRAQARDLTLFGSPLPTASTAGHPLTSAQVEALGVVPPSTTGATTRPRRASVPPRSQSVPTASRRPPQRARAPAPAIAHVPAILPVVASDPPSSPDGGGSPERRSSAHRSPSRSISPPRETSRSPPATGRRVAELERMLADQNERIQQLFAQQLAEPHEDVSSAYVVLDEVWHQLGKHPSEDKCSWLNIPALKRREISEIVRTQSGTYPHFPCELDVVGGMKKLPGVKDAQISLLDFAQTEVTKFMRSNARTVRLGGTAFSRSLEMHHDLATFLADSPDATEIPLDWVLEFVEKVLGATRGAFVASIDTQTALRLAVSHRLEKALKVDHLTTTNPLRAEREDFIPPSAMRRIEDAAKRNLDLSWALDQALGKASFSGRRPENSSRGGKADYARQRGGRGGGSGKGKSTKGSGNSKGGKGRGRGSAPTPRADARADPGSPE